LGTPLRRPRERALTPVSFEEIDFTLPGENMGRFDGGRQREADHEAYLLLWNLWWSSRRMVANLDNWESACGMLQTRYTVARARQDSEVCAMRIRYLEISEPLPRLADFVHAPPYYRLPDARRQLALASHEYRLARQRHPNRERQRLRELETTKALYEVVKAAEASARQAEVARRREWQRSRWPKDVVLDSEIYNLEGVAAQVGLQNAKIEAQVSALTDLLADGLRNLPEVSESDRAASYRAGDPAGIAAHVESVLTAMPLPRGINPKATVAYSPDARRLVVEYELPTVGVVPRAKSYRYVKSRETVVEAARTAPQVKALYASTIAQLTLVSLAAILKLDSERHIDVVIFNGVVETQDPGSGQPIRPCLIAVRVTRDALAEINFEGVDPTACLKQLSAAVSRNPTRFVPVRPLLE
jgi:restriction system protein